MMSGGVFDGQALAEKLTKLNNSQQSIESLSRWCISHRKKARLIVETWNKLFNTSSKEQCVSFLYLANDILQNSRRKGNEFVNEFWKVIPLALKHVYGNGGDHGKKAATRLVNIWEERKVFGSRGKNLRDEMLGNDPPPPTVSNGKGSNPIKIVRRDGHSVRIKLAIGGLPEKIVTAFQSVHEERFDEEGALNKYEAAVMSVRKLEKDVETCITQGSEQAPALVDELADQENALEQCIGQLESVEASRATLISQLKEALHDQEPKLELIRSQLQVARLLVEQAECVKQRIVQSRPASLTTIDSSSQEILNVFESNLPLSQPSQPSVSFVSEESKKATAAAVAAQLTASTSSAQVLTSVLSSLVAEEAASMNGLDFSCLQGISHGKRPKLEKPLPLSDSTSSDVTFISHIQPATFPPPPPPPPLPPNPPISQYVQSAPYGFNNVSLPPPPPLPSHVSLGLVRSGPQPSQQQASNGGFYRPPGIGFYGPGHQPATQQVPQQ